ncbi:MAG: ParB/RepB/Spo0J family partition protein [Clostridiales bacterium]|nr:ParB/RepB/Spo0J family partition protein [Clostridiales bacterium]
MNDKKPQRGLGKGLAALLPETPAFLAVDKTGSESVLALDISLIKPNPHQPRRFFDEEKLAELAISIKEYGLLQPLVVTEASGGGYIIIAGERRWRAARSIGLIKISCIIRSMEQQQLQELSLIENIQRENLLPLEEAQAYRDLLDQYNYTQDELAARLGKSRSHVTNTLRLLNLAPQFQSLLRQGLISAGHARALLSLADEEKRAFLAGRIVKDGLSVRQAEQLAQELREAPLAEKAKKPAPPHHPVFADIARRLKDLWGVKVAVYDKKGRGKIVIDYYSEDDLQRILDSLLEDTL